MEKSSLQLLRNKCLNIDKNHYRKHFSKNFDYQDSDASNKNDTSLVKRFTTSGNYPIETLNRKFICIPAEK